MADIPKREWGFAFSEHELVGLVVIGISIVVAFNAWCEKECEIVVWIPQHPRLSHRIPSEKQYLRVFLIQFTSLEDSLCEKCLCNSEKHADNNQCGAKCKSVLTFFDRFHCFVQMKKQRYVF